jgi:hypothetical protein
MRNSSASTSLTNRIKLSPKYIKDYPPIPKICPKRPSSSRRCFHRPTNKINFRLLISPGKYPGVHSHLYLTSRQSQPSITTITTHPSKRSIWKIWIFLEATRAKKCSKCSPQTVFSLVGLARMVSTKLNLIHCWVKVWLRQYNIKEKLI